MKISPRDAENFVKNPPPEVVAVLVYGHDKGLIVERATALGKASVADINDPFTTTRLEPDSLADDPALLLDSAAAISPMGGKRLVLVSDAGANVTEACKNLLANPPPESLTIIAANESINTKAALVKVFEDSKIAASIGCYADTTESLSRMAEEMFRAASIRVERDALAWIVSHLGADRMASRQEIEKLVLLAGEGGELSLTQTQEALGDGAQVAASDITYAVASGRFGVLGRALGRAEAEAIPGEALLGHAARYFARLYRISVAISEGSSTQDAIKSIKPPIFFMEQRQIEEHLRHWNQARARYALNRLSIAEKQGRKGVDSRLAASQALLDIANMVRGGSATT